jgi:hypothetical protein
LLLFVVVLPRRRIVDIFIIQAVVMTKATGQFYVDFFYKALLNQAKNKLV